MRVRPKPPSGGSTPDARLQGGKPPARALTGNYGGSSYLLLLVFAPLQKDEVYKAVKEMRGR